LTWQLLGDSLERARAHAAEGSIILDSGRGAALCWWGFVEDAVFWRGCGSKGVPSNSNSEEGTCSKRLRPKMG